MGKDKASYLSPKREDRPAPFAKCPQTLCRNQADPDCRLCRWRSPSR